MKSNLCASNLWKTVLDHEFPLTVRFAHSQRLKSTLDAESKLYWLSANYTESLLPFVTIYSYVSGIRKNGHITSDPQIAEASVKGAF